MLYLWEVLSLVVTYVLLCLWGMPVLLVSEPEQMKMYRFITTPVFGFGTVLLVLYYLFRVGIPIGKSALLATICVILLDIILIIRKKVILSKGDMKRIGIAAFTILVIGGFLFLPLGIFEETFSSLGYGNGDWGNYGIYSSIIKYNSYSQAANLSSMLDTCFNSQTRGAILLVAYIGSLFPFSVWNALDTIFLFSFLLVVLSGAMLGHLVGKNWKTGLLTGILFLFNCGYIYLIQKAFLGQISSIPILMTGTAYLLYDDLNQETLPHVDLKRTLSIGFLLSTMAITYMEQIPFAGFLMLVILAAAFLDGKDRGIALCKEYLIAVLVFTVLYGQGYKAFYKVIFTIGGVKAGWPVPSGGVLQAVGIYNTYFGTLGAADFIEWPDKVTIIVSILLTLVLMTYIIIRIGRPARKKLISIMLSYNILYLIFLLNFPSYQAFKGLVNLEYFFVLIFSVMCADGLFTCVKMGIPGKIFSILSLSLILLVLANGTDFYQRLFGWYSESVNKENVYNIGLLHGDSDNYELESFLEQYAESEVIVRSAELPDGMEATVAAVEAGIPIDRISNADGYCWWNVDMKPTQDKFLNIESNAIQDSICTVGRVIFQNETFQVRECDKKYPICAERGQGGYIHQITESGYAIVGRDMNGEEYNLTYESDNTGTYDLAIKIVAQDERMCVLKMNGKEIRQLQVRADENTYIMRDVLFSKGTNILSFTEHDGHTLEGMWLMEISLNNSEIREISDRHSVKINSMSFPNGFMGTFWKWIYLQSPIKKFIKNFAARYDYRLSRGDVARIADGLVNNDKTVQMELFSMCLDDEIIISGSDEEFILFCYNYLLDRQPGNEELENWNNALKSGVTREEAFCQFLSSSEFHSQKSIENPAEIPLINKFIEEFADRFDYKLKDDNIDRIAEGLMADDMTVQRELFSMCREEKLSASVSDEEYVIFLYNTLLNRKPEDSEVEVWITALKSGAMREEVFCYFLSSSEFHSIYF